MCPTYITAFLDGSAIEQQSKCLKFSGYVAIYTDDSFPLTVMSLILKEKQNL